MIKKEKSNESRKGNDATGERAAKREKSERQLQLAPVETRFAELIWENSPLSAAELAKLAEKELGWKRTTSYTVLKRLCGRGFFALEEGEARVLVSREEYFSSISGQIVEESFSGSLPAFIAAFAREKRLSEAEISEIRKIIDSYGDGSQGEKNPERGRKKSGGGEKK